MRPVRNPATRHRLVCEAMRRSGLGPGEPMRRAVKLRSNLVKRRTSILARLDARLEILGPGWHAALNADLANKAPLRFLAHYADPHLVIRLGRARLTRFLYRHSRGSWGEDKADELIAAARETIELWSDELDFPDLADDIAIEAHLALQLTDEIKELDTRIAALLDTADPRGIVCSAPGIGPILAAQILGRLGDPNRFCSLAAIRSFSGLVPKLDSSGLSGKHGGPTKSGDACLREALFMAAQQARRSDPSLAAKYHRLMTETGKHHNSAVCHLATTLLTRIAACWRRGEHYIIQDIDGSPVTPEQARAIIADRYTVPPGSALPAAQPATQGRADDIRSRTALHRSARQQSRLRAFRGLDIR
ncbi:transposase [Nocardia terpenica]|uniref:Transposase n=1 Tax=Nocardia terpenica TaxID=455432 RepID=A0A6G9ZEI6_9NOCA|nr:transposase [Nocardia terpenica]